MSALGCGLNGSTQHPGVVSAKDGLGRYFEIKSLGYKKKTESSLVPAASRT